MSEARILKALKEALEESRGSKIAVALSGGLDSMVLAEGLRRLEAPFTALHVDHGWRAKQSVLDARWVREWCRKRSISFMGKKLPASLARTEAAGRDARLAFYRKVSEQRGFQEVWLAHHGDDLAETFLLQLLRGAGPEGLASMPSRRTIGSLLLVRPLLGCRKAELEKAARAWSLEWREDESNRSDDYLRNRVRRQLLPCMKKITGRDPAPALARCSRILGDENSHWEGLLPEEWPEKLPCRDLKKASVALQRRTIRGWLIFRKISDLSFEDVELVRGLLLKDRPSKVNLGKGRHCRRQQGFLFVE